MLEGDSWDQKKWDWEKSLLHLRTSISNKTDDVFKKPTKQSNETLVI